MKFTFSNVASVLIISVGMLSWIKGMWKNCWVMNHCKSMAIPGSKGKESTGNVADLTEKLDPQEHRGFRSGAGRWYYPCAICRQYNRVYSQVFRRRQQWKNCEIIGGPTSVDAVQLRLQDSYSSNLSRPSLVHHEMYTFFNPDRTVRPVVCCQATENPKPKRMRIPNRNGETRIIPTYRNGCKNSEIVDDRVPEHRLTREFLSEDQTYKGHLQKTYWRSRTSCRKFWWLDYSRSQGPQRQLRISKQSSICSRGAGLGHPMDPNLSVQNKNFTGNSKKLAEVPGTREKLEVIYTDNSLEFGKACEDFSWNHWTSHHRSETNGIAERAVRRVKEGTSAVLLQSGLKESWWVVSMECYTYLRNVTGNLKSFTLTIPWNLARLVKNFPWIIERERRTDRKQKLGAVRGNKERTSAVLLQSGLGNEWWAASMECHCYLRNIQDLLSDGKTIWKAVRNAF